MQICDLNRDSQPFLRNDSFEARQSALRHRVAEAAGVLSNQGVRPTVARVRAALGGGSPNELAPALKAWKDLFQPVTHSGGRDLDSRPLIPVEIADLAGELWQRAMTAAAIELKGGSAARQAAAQTAEAESLTTQVNSLRDQLQRELIAFGELRAQGARDRAIARDALARLDASEARERKQLRELGTVRDRIAELEATVVELRAGAASSAPLRQRRTASGRNTHSSKPVKAPLVKPPRQKASRTRQSKLDRKQPLKTHNPGRRSIKGRAKLVRRSPAAAKKTRTQTRASRRSRR